MMRSAIPSPFTSPAPETDHAAPVEGVDPVEAEAVGPVEIGEIQAGGEAPAGAEHHIALTGVGIPIRIRAVCAPMMISAIPSPFTSPAPETDRSRSGRAASIPSRRKPFKPLRFFKLTLTIINIPIYINSNRG